MKNLGLAIISFAFYLSLSSCSSSYATYWHEEEDDVYFTSITKEEVTPTVYSSNEDEDVNDNSSVRTYDPNRTYRNRTYYPRTRRSTPRTPRSTSPKTNKPSIKKSPTPSRPSRPKPKTGTPQ